MRIPTWLLTLVVVALVAPLASAAPAPRVTVYYNAGCADCGPYLLGDLLPALRAIGLSNIVLNDVGKDPSLAREWTSANARWSVPQRFAAHLAVFVGDSLTIQDHVPGRIVQQALAALLRPPRTLLWVSNMHGTAHEYVVWDFAHDPATLPLDASPAAYLAAGAGSVPPAFVAAPPPPPLSERFGLVLPVILAGALTDGTNPCALAVLLFLVAFLFAVRTEARRMRQLAFLYIVTVGVVYFLLGAGLLRFAQALTQGHLIVRIGAWVAILGGLLGVVGAVWPRYRLKVGMTQGMWERVQARLRTATVPGTVVAGFLMGLCTIPCSGYVYVGIVGLLSARTTYWTGLGYLGLYNLAYVAPLVAVAALITNRATARWAAGIERAHNRTMRLATNGLAALIGAAILLWFS